MESLYQWWTPAMSLKTRLLRQLQGCLISVWFWWWDLTSRHNYFFSSSSFSTKNLIMAWEEAVSKGRCVVTVAQRRSWSHVLPLSDLLTLFFLGDIADASLCLEQRVWRGTPWVSWPVGLPQARAMQSLPVYPDKPSVLPSLPLAGLHSSSNKEWL